MELNDILNQSDPLSEVILDPMADYYERPPLVSIGGIRLLSASNISAIVGPPKSRKTSLAMLIVGAYLRGRVEDITRHVAYKGNVLWIDTEQSPSDCQNIYRRLARLRGMEPEGVMDDVTFLTLRDKEPEQRWELTKKAIYSLQPAIVVIDGVADLVVANNDESESVRLQNFLLNASLHNDCHIMNIIHSNYGSDKARGHTGSNLTRKCETVMTVVRGGDRSTVTFTTRGHDLKPMAFELEGDAVPYPCAPIIKNTQDYILMLRSIMGPRESVTWTELVKRITDYKDARNEHVSDRQIKNIASICYKKHFLYKRKNGSYERGDITNNPENLDDGNE